MKFLIPDTNFFPVWNFHGERRLTLIFDFPLIYAKISYNFQYFSNIRLLAARIQNLFEHHLGPKQK